MGGGQMRLWILALFLATGLAQAPFKLTVTGFPEGADIPKRLTCDGGDLSPALQWAGEPSGTQSFALVVDDPDAPGGTWNHWLVWDIPAHVHGLPEGAVGRRRRENPGRTTSVNAAMADRVLRRGGAHRYFFRLLAVDVPALGLSAGAKRPALEKALKKHTIADTSYVGRYERK